MCGFVGLRRFDGAPVDAAQLSQLAAIAGHRGPDGEGVWVDGDVGLAHRRLAIIDPNGSPQPMGSVDGSLHIAFNGEILNYRELRTATDYPYRTSGDTEVLLALHRSLGAGAVPLLRGQFAYALHDDGAAETWLVRDRLGVLPLFYVQQPGWIAFASEIKSLLPLLPQLAVDENSLELYLRRRAVPSPATLVEGIRKLPPGHIARIDRTGNVDLTCYWSPTWTADRQVGDAESVRLVRDALDAAVDDNLVADVPIGAYLSGGLDSSLIAALATKRVEPGSMHTFSAGFGDDRVDELPFARTVSSALGTIHHEVSVRAEDFETHWRNLTWHRDAPMSEPADVAVYKLAATASQHVKVVLSGEGADEIFAGYPKHRMARLSELPLPGPVRTGFDLVQRATPPRFSRVRIALRALSASTPNERSDAWFAPFTSRERGALLGHRPSHGDADIAEPGTPLKRMLMSDCGSWLADNLLERGDRMTMAASVELRPPFLDHRLVELGLSLPDRVKIRRGSGKWVVRQIAAAELPTEIVERRKAGFRVPLDRWFRGGLRTFAWDTLLSNESFVGQVFDRREIEQLLLRHDRARTDENIRIWTLLSLEIWHDVTFRTLTARPIAMVRG